MDPSQVYFPSITGMNYIFTRATNVRQLLNSLNRLATHHIFNPLGIILTESGFRNMVRNTLLKMDDIVMPSHLDKFQKQFSKSTA
jgi:homogentisate 1,2-dioxygenase